MTGTVTGTSNQSGGGPPSPASLTVIINCHVTYPPLDMGCEIIISAS